MDENDYPSLASLARANAQLAANSARVDAIVTAQLDAVERLFRAAAAQDWHAIGRLMAVLVKQADLASNRRLAESANQVRDALRRDPSGKLASPKLAKLLSECRAARLRPSG